MLPLPADGWEWAGLPVRSARDLAQDTALLLRQMAEGQSFQPGTSTNPWVIAGYVLGGLFVLILALIFFSAFMSNL